MQVEPEGKTDFDAWRQRGLSILAAAAASAAGCASASDVRRLGYLHFKGLPEVGRATLAELNQVAGGWPDAPKPRGRWLQRQAVGVLLEELRRRGVHVPVATKAD